MPDQPTNRKFGHALPVLALVVGVLVLLALTQRSIAGVVARFVAGLWVGVMELVLGLIGGLFGG